MNNNSTRWMAIGVLLLVVLVFAFIARHRQTAAPVAAQPSVKVAVARLGTFDVRIKAQGRVGPPPGSQAALAFATPGKIQSIFVHAGDRVSIGQQVAQLDTSGLALTVAQASGDARAAAGSYSSGAVPASVLHSAQQRLAAAAARLNRLQTGGPASQSDQISAQSILRQAQIKVQSDERNLQRARTLYSGGVLAAKDVQAAQTQLDTDRADAAAAQAKAQAAGVATGTALLQARSDYAQAQADVIAAQSQSRVLSGQAARAQATLAAAERDLANATLRAPNDGVVVAVLKHVGESVDATVPVIQLSPSSQDDVTLSVPGVDARQIKVGDRVDLRLPRSAKSSRGRVVAVVPSVDPATQQGTVVVRGVPRSAVAGDAVEASILVAKRSGLLVPTSAVVQDPQTGKQLVFVEKNQDGKQGFTPRQVGVGSSDETTTEIASGLRSGETIAVEGAYDLLAPGSGG